MNEHIHVPDSLRKRIEHDVRPVRPLLEPWQRAGLLVPAAVLAWIAAPAVLGVREDIHRLGPLLAWGGSAAQLVIALVLIAMALREAVPAQSVSRSSAFVWLTLGAAATLLLTLATSMVSPEPFPRLETFGSWAFCFDGAVLVGAPLSMTLIVLIARALPMRPLLAGALAGMGSGAAVDGGWRLYCNYSNPSHVLGSHGGAVLFLTVIGLTAGGLIQHHAKPRRNSPRRGGKS
jgi:hypothetical protein